MNSALMLLYWGAISLFVIAISWRWVIFGIKLMFFTFLWKGRQNVALGLIRNLGNNIGIPAILHIKDNREDSGDKINMYDRGMFTEGTLFGYPFAIFDIEDTKTSVGIYAKIKAKITGKNVGESYAYCRIRTKDDGTKEYEEITQKQYELYKSQVDAEGLVVTHKLETGRVDDKTGKPLYIDTGIPVLEKMKSSVTVSPHLMKTVIAAAALSKAIEEFVKKNKMILMVAGIAALAAAVAAFFSYTNQNSISQLCAVQLPQVKDEIVRACAQAAQNLSK